MSSVTESAAQRLPRTYLFVPGNRPDRFDRALESGAGAIIVDLEDAVAVDSKSDARAAFEAWYRSQPPGSERILLRINDQSTSWFEDDLALVKSTGVRGIMLPKAESATHIDRAASALPDDGFVIPLIETAAGILELQSIASAARTQRLAFGTIDYALDLDLTGDERGLLYPACQIALISRAVRIAAPIAGVTADLADERKLLADVAFARACGFSAKLCIHPRQVLAIEAGLRPAEADILWARRVIAATETSTGAVQVDGKMIDQPVVARARRILDQAS